MAEANSSGQGKFDRGTSFRPPVGFMEFKSQMSTTKEVMEALRNGDINIIGIYGKSGIGKTTMLKHVAMKAIKENLFDEIVMVVLGSKTRSLSNIQGQIADKLGLKLEEETLLERATWLRQRLANGKRILLVLEDVWDELGLDAIGIPFGGENKGCKVVLTSEWQLFRSAQKNIRVKPLTEEEAWHLFKEMAGNSVDASDIRPIAKQVVNECEGLPLTLIVIARAMKNKSNFVWTDALERLRIERIARLRRLERTKRRACTSSYNSSRYAHHKSESNMQLHTSLLIQLSYNYLEDDEAKSLFLLCCLYPENHDIHIENLVRYGLGLRLFKDINELGEARDRVRSLVDQLKNCYLLSDSDKDKDECVKMHAVLHAVGTSIASTGENAFLIWHGKSFEWPKNIQYKNYTSISVISDEIKELPGWLRCPKLRMLLLTCMNNSLKTSDNFFDEMKNLQVLNLDLSIPLLPSSLQFLRNLNTLTLFLPNCKLENISQIGKLLNLEILHFCAPSIKVLPEEIGRLANLTLLDLTGCHHLDRISPGVISGLIRLQELYMIDCFSVWKADKGEGEEGRRNAILTELQSMSDLKILEIYIPDAALLPRNPLFANLTKYKIRIGDNGWWSRFPFQKHLLWKINKFIALHAGISMLLKCTELLSLKGKGSRIVVHELLQDGVQHLKYLSIECCDTLMCLADTMDLSLDSSAAVFPILESLKLDDLCRLKEICCGQLPAGSFGKLRTLTLQLLPSLTHFLVENPAQPIVSLHNLRSVELDRCNGLRNLFSLSMARELVQLQELHISHCEMMEEVIWEGRGEDGHAANKIEFPRLEYIALTQLEGLTSFSRGIDKIKFPQLKTLHIKCLPKVKSFFPNDSTPHSDENRNATLQSIFPQRVAFPSLEELELVGLPNVSDLWGTEVSAKSFCKLRLLMVSDCHGLVRNVFPAHILKMSPNLEEVEIYNCDLVEDVFGFGGHQGIPYAKRTLTVRCCGSLRNLFSPSIVRGEVFGFGGHQGIPYGKIRTLTVRCCGCLRNLFSPSIVKGEVFGFGGHQGIPYAKIRTLTVRCCGSLRNLFSPSIVRGLMCLQELKIDGCPTLEEVIWEGRGEDGHVTNEIEFSCLEYMELRELESLTSFSRGIDKIEFPQLKKLHIKCLPKVESFFANESTLHSDENCNATLQSIFHRKVAFPSLEELELNDLPNVSDLWCSELSTGSFCKLRSLKVKDCHGLVRNVVPAHILQMSPDLEIVEIYNCDSVEEVFGFEGHQGNPLVNIRTLIVGCCGSLRNLFSPSIARCFVHLQKLIIYDCSEMEAVIANEDEEQEGGERIYVTLFPQLMHLELRDLPSLRRFCHAIYEWGKPSLYHLEAVNCPEQTIQHLFEQRNDIRLQQERRQLQLQQQRRQQQFRQIMSQVQEPQQQQHGGSSGSSLGKG